jgi:hypothetical protein
MLLRKGLSNFILFTAAPIVCAQGGGNAARTPEKLDAQAIVAQAVANFKERESLPKDYTYVETVKATDARLKRGRGTDVYEVIEVNGHAFRRHVEQDGRKIARTEKQDDGDREKLLEVQRKILEEEIRPGHTRESLQAAVRKIMEDSGLKDWETQLTLAPNVHSMGVVQFTQTLYGFKLPIDRLDHKFEVKLKEEKLLNGRMAYVVQADPKHSKDKSDPAANFKMKVWIDEKELQIAKVEGEALRMAPLVAADYSSYASRHMSEKEMAAEKQRLAASKLYYGDDTKIVEEWTKINDEIWLPQHRHVKGSHLFLLQENTRPAYSSKVEYDIVDSDYRKFRVQHRFLSRLNANRAATSEQR